VSGPSQAATPVLDIRTYKLVPGARDDFDRLFREGALPMLQHFGIEVIAYGPSVDGDDYYCLMRAFASTSRREELLDAFYGGEEWQQNYREAVMALIEGYHTVVIPLTPELPARIRAQRSH